MPYLGNTASLDGLTHNTALSAFQMEMMAVLQAVQAAVAHNARECIFYTESELLVRTLGSSDALQFADWQAYTELMQLYQLLLLHTQYKCIFRSREEVHLANELANLARTKRFSYTGCTFPLFLTI